jgi:hypothetical protein
MQGPTRIQNSVCVATRVDLGCPSGSSGQKLCVKKPSGSYLRFTSHSRCQLSPKVPLMRWCDSCMPKDWRCTVFSSAWQTLKRAGTATYAREGAACRRGAEGVFHPLSQWQVSGGAGRNGGDTLTFSALVTQRRSSSCGSHWWKAAAVQAA